MVRFYWLTFLLTFFLNSLFRNVRLRSWCAYELTLNKLTLTKPKSVNLTHNHRRAVLVWDAYRLRLWFGLAGSIVEDCCDSHEPVMTLLPVKLKSWSNLIFQLSHCIRLNIKPENSEVKRFSQLPRCARLSANGRPAVLNSIPWALPFPTIGFAIVFWEVRRLSSSSRAEAPPDHDRVAPFRVRARKVSVVPSYSIPRNFNGFNHFPSFLTNPLFSGAISIPQRSLFHQFRSREMALSLAFSPSSAYWTVTFDINSFSRAKILNIGERGDPCGTPR
jgi:hypothetical protein